jgi:hypothetical protein
MEGSVSVGIILVLGKEIFNWLTLKKNIYEKDNLDDAPCGKQLCCVCTE